MQVRYVFIIYNFSTRTRDTFFLEDAGISVVEADSNGVRQLYHSAKTLYKLLVHVGVGGLVVTVLSIAPMILGFKPCRGQWICKDDQNP
jgi:hypothetical protein